MTERVRIKQSIERIPGGLMVVPLLAGAALNTIDQMHLEPVRTALAYLGATPDVHGQYEFLRIGSFTEALFKNGALPLIGLFLVCVGAQMSFAVGKTALRKGAAITSAKFGAAVLCGYLLATFTDPFSGFLGLSMVAVIAAMANGNGGLYAALAGQYGSRSDVGALSVISINDGPFLTLIALGIFGERLPIIAFIAVLTPLLLGFVLGNLDREVRNFLKPGTELTIPFFAFALGAQMDLGVFGDEKALVGGLALGMMTLIFTGLASVVTLRLIGHRSQVAGVAEASTAGNAVQTPVAVAAAAAAAAAAGLMDAGRAAMFETIVPLATAQITISVMTTALLCPIAVILWSKGQNARGIDGRIEPADLDDDSGPGTSALLGDDGRGD